MRIHVIISMIIREKGVVSLYRKKLLRGSVSASASICAVLCFAAGASAAEPDGSWQQNGDSRSYICADDHAAVGTVSIEGVDYLFAPNGIQQVGWQTVRDQRRYYDPATGEPVTGWLHWRGADYYIDPVSGKQTGIFTIDNIMFLADSCGVLQRESFCEIGDVWYYGDADGKPVSGETVIGGVPYLFTEEHRLLTG